MRKLFSIIMALLATSALWAYDFQSGDLYYNITSDTTVEVTSQSTSYPYNEGLTFTTVTIPETVTSNGTTYSITSIGTYAFRSCTSLTSITIPSSVTNIGERAFYGCSSLSSITIPDSVTSIGNYAFLDCISLISISIPNSITNIGKSAFNSCSSLTSITIPSSVTNIGERAFCGCSSLSSLVVEIGNTIYDSRDNCNAIIETATNTLIAGCGNTTIPNSVTSIGESAFRGCSSLTSVTIPNSVTSIGEDAFFGCSSLTSVTIPNSVTSIGEYAFYACFSLTSVTIPNSVTSIGDNAFSWCESLITIKTEAITPPTLENNVFNGCDKLSAIYIPDNTLSAYQQAWGDEYTYINNENALNIHVEVPGTLEDLISNTGANPTLVTRLTLTGTLNDDDFTCMRETMSSLVDVDLSRILNTSGVDFYNKDELVRVVLPNTLEHIGEYAFWGCSLTSITIPNSITNIGERAFFGCSSLVTLIVEEGNSIYDSRDNCNAVIETATNTLIAGCNKTTIPKSVTNIGERAFYNCYKLTSITIPNSVTSIGSGAFSDCWGLNSVTIGNNITNIRNSAFSGCSSLTSITIPNSVTSIGENAFYGCSSLTSVVVEKGNPTYDSRENCNAIIETATNTLIVGCGNTTIPNSVTSIGDRAFSGCSSLTSIIIPSSVTSIGNNVFSSCFNLTSMVVEDGNTTYDSRDNCNAIIETATNTLIAGCGNTAIPNSVTSIGYGAFMDCNALTSVTIPHSIASIGDCAFSGCSSLTSIIIPSSVTSIGDYAFAYSYDLDTIRVEATTPPILGSYVFSSTPTSFCYIPCGTLTAYQASDWAQYVGEFVEEGCVDSTMIITYTSSDGNIVTPYKANAFAANIVSNTYENGVGTITFDAPVTSIGRSAFEDCSSLTSITIPNSVTSIGDDAFHWCSLTSITIPNSVTSIGDRAFRYCSSLASITIPNSVVSIGRNAFEDCSSLVSIIIPESVTSIGLMAFSACHALTSMVVEDGNIIYDSRDNCNAIIETATNTLIAGCGTSTIPSSVTNIGHGAFSSCFSLTSITIPNSVTSIGNYAFLYCHYLTSITIPNSVTSIGERAFEGCWNLTSITIPNNVTSIGLGAFSACDALTSMVVEDGNIIYDSRDNCNAIIETASNTLIAGCQNTIIPESVTSIGNYTFERYSSLTSITIPNSVTSIGAYAFHTCSSLTSITIPNSVTSIGNEAFRYCSSLSSITIGNSVMSIGYEAFSSCSSLTSITIPNSVTSIGAYAFSNCSSLDTIYVEATAPPALRNYTFSYTPASICCIPCGTLTAYEASDWAQYVGEFVEDCDNKCGNQLYWGYDSNELSIIGYGNMYDYDLEPQPWQQYRNKMQTISLPEGMTSIGASAFADCKYVKSVTIPSTVEKIYDSAFEDCRMLATLTFAEPSALISIGNWAFYNNHELKSVVIPDGVTEIGYAAFYGCTYLDELTLPASMEYIADNSFALCAKLRRMNVSAAIPPVVEARTFEDVDRSIPVVVPDASVNQYKDAPVWQEFNIIGKNSVSTSVDNVDTSTCGVEKLLRDGQLIILRDGVEYNVMGQEL